MGFQVDADRGEKCLACPAIKHTVMSGAFAGVIHHKAIRRVNVFMGANVISAVESIIRTAADCINLAALREADDAFLSNIVRRADFRPVCQRDIPCVISCSAFEKRPGDKAPGRNLRKRGGVSARIVMIRPQLCGVGGWPSWLSI